jgi:hypothetical protein
MRSSPSPVGAAQFTCVDPCPETARACGLATNVSEGCWLCADQDAAVGPVLVGPARFVAPDLSTDL